MKLEKVRARSSKVYQIGFLGIFSHSEYSRHVDASLRQLGVRLACRHKRF
jgi:hypothetical protein